MEEILIKIVVCIVAVGVLWLFLKALKLILKLAVIGVVVFVIWYFFAPLEDYILKLFNFG